MSEVEHKLALQSRSIQERLRNVQTQVSVLPVRTCTAGKTVTRCLVSLLFSRSRNTKTPLTHETVSCCFSVTYFIFAEKTKFTSNQNEVGINSRTLRASYAGESNEEEERPAGNRFARDATENRSC